MVRPWLLFVLLACLCASGVDMRPRSEPDTVTIMRFPQQWRAEGAVYSGTGRFDDINGGMPIVFEHARGQSVAEARLGEGKLFPHGLCVFTATLSRHPGHFGALVGSRKHVTCTADQEQRALGDVGCGIYDE